MKKLSLCCLLILCVTFCLTYGQDSKFSALYVLNIGKMIGWPPSESQGDFTITVVGDDPIFDQLKTLGAATKIGDQSIVVNKANSLDKIDKCHILYISPDKSNLLATAQGKFGASNCLIITNKDGFAKEGACINLITVGGKLTFEINVESLKKNGLTAKPALFKLGKTI